MDPVLINEENSQYGDIILQIDSTYPRLKPIFLKSELPNQESVISKILVNVCGLEKLEVKQETRIMNENKEKDKWKQITFTELFKFSQAEGNDCPIEAYKVCQDAKCQKQIYDSDSFKVGTDKFEISLGKAVSSKVFYLGATTKG